jgi:hypothetical protein
VWAPCRAGREAGRGEMERRRSAQAGEREGGEEGRGDGEGERGRGVRLVHVLQVQCKHFSRTASTVLLPQHVLRMQCEHGAEVRVVEEGEGEEGGRPSARAMLPAAHAQSAATHRRICCDAPAYPPR